MCLSHSYIAMGACIASLGESGIAPWALQHISRADSQSRAWIYIFCNEPEDNFLLFFFTVKSSLCPSPFCPASFVSLAFSRDTSKAVLQNGLFRSCISPRVYRVSWSYSLETWVHSDSLYIIINRHRDGKKPSHTRGEHKHQCDVHKLMKTGLCETHGSVLLNVLAFPVPFLWLVTELWIAILVFLLLLYFMRTIPCP